ncbi:AAA family ATPase [Roseibium album]|uniref:AAA family ATPase n=1 Tax=Roseibium album TaxID=311410 RepID=UPI003D662EAB
MSSERPYLRLNRLRILRRGQTAYDQNFHEGVNIIRGDNGSGKSTIADFIFLRWVVNTMIGKRRRKIATRFKQRLKHLAVNWF